MTAWKLGTLKIILRLIYLSWLLRHGLTGLLRKFLNLVNKNCKNSLNLKKVLFSWLLKASEITYVLSKKIKNMLSVNSILGFLPAVSVSKTLIKVDKITVLIQKNIYV